MGLASELQEAVDSIPEEIPTEPKAEGTEEEPWTDEEMAAFLEDHPMVMVLLAEDFGLDEIMEAMEAGMATLTEKGTGPKKGGGGGNPGNDPFATEPLHGTSSAGIGGGKKNPRKRTGECPKGSCSCSGGVCTCQCKSLKTGKSYTKKIDMSGYYAGKKADYMAHWRVNHGPVHKGGAKD